MQSHARVVVVGGGVVGCSILYHLTEAGWSDAVLIAYVGWERFAALCVSSGVLILLAGRGTGGAGRRCLSSLKGPRDEGVASDTSRKGS